MWPAKGPHGHRAAVRDNAHGRNAPGKGATQRLHQSAALPWKESTQARGRAKVDAILEAASALAVEQGHLDFKMTAVAERAGVPIGLVYQFFPRRTALLARLFAKEMEPIDASLKEPLSGASSIQTVLGGIKGPIRDHVELVKTRPALFVIWSSPTMEPVLQETDFQNSLASADVIATRMMDLAGESVDQAAVQDTALLVCHLWGHVVRLSVLAHDRHGIVDQYIAMIEAHLEKLLAR